MARENEVILYSGGIIRVKKTFRFEAGHHLPYHQGVCKSQHGHSYKLSVEVEGPIKPEGYGPNSGMVMDFGQLKKIVSKHIINQFDHRYLNDVFSNPTAENIVQYIAIFINSNSVLPEGVKLTELLLWETENSCAKWIRK